MWDSFQAEGVMPEIQRMMKKLRRASLKDAGMSLRTSLGMPSGPGALLFLRERKTLSKV